MSILLGCIADDFTGATDLCNTLVRRGMRTIQLIDVPRSNQEVSDADAVVIALKSRTIPASEAIQQSLAALEWLRAADCRQFFFKYCSTFDSTSQGNIGPVAEALLEALKSEFTIACPAFPETGRTIFKGHLFVNDVLLNESGMENHPLTPMTDANLVRVLQAQTKGKVGLVQYQTIRQGAETIQTEFEHLQSAGYRFAITDALDDAHLEWIGEACAKLPLITGGSGIALGLPENYRRQGLLGSVSGADQLPSAPGLAAVLSGSCSRATLGQVEQMKKTHPSFQIDPLKLAAGDDQAAQALHWARPQLADGPVLIYASAEPAAVRKAQDELGRARAGELIEQAMATIAQGLLQFGVRRLVVAGGETSGAVVGALGVTGLRIGPQIDPGVPWTVSLSEPPLALALKSGNFGAPDFFLKALRALPA